MRDRFFDKKNDLRHIRKLRFWPIDKVLTEKYKFEAPKARQVHDFLLPILQWEPNARKSAADCLKSEWLNLDR